MNRCFSFLGDTYLLAMKKNTLKDLLERIVNRRATARDIGLFDKYIYQHQTTEDSVSEDVGDRIWDEISRESGGVRVISAQPHYFMKVAAVIVLLIAATVTFFLLSSPDGGHYYTKNNLKEIILIDGTKVILNQHSEIKLADGFGISNRNLDLSGEAFWEVRRNEDLPFTITSNEVKVTVLGTKFNVLAYPNESALVSVQSGKVQVSHQNKTVVLVANKQAYFDGDHFIESSFEADSHLNFAWMDGSLVFPNLPFDEAIQRIARFHDIKLDYRADKTDCLVRGSFDRTDELDEILQGLAFTYNLQYEYTDSLLIIKFLECN